MPTPRIVDQGRFRFHLDERKRRDERNKQQKRLDPIAAAVRDKFKDTLLELKRIDSENPEATLSVVEQFLIDTLGNQVALVEDLQETVIKLSAQVESTQQELQKQLDKMRKENEQRFARN